MNGYKATYRSESIEVYAETALKAQLKASEHFKAKKACDVWITVFESNTDSMSARLRRTQESNSELLEACKAALAWNRIDIEAFEDAAPTMQMLQNRTKALQEAIAKAEGNA